MATVGSPTHTPVADSELRAWVDKNQISEVITLCCRAADRVDIPLLRSLFHPDATDDHGGMYSGDIELAYSFLAERAEGSTTTTDHRINNMYIELDGDTARSETYAIACHHRDIDGERCDEFIGLRYLDRLERRADRVWRISARKVVWDWWRTMPVTELTLWADPADPRFAHGVRGPADPSYSWFDGTD